MDGDAAGLDRVDRIVGQLSSLMRDGYKLSNADVKTAADLVAQDESVDLSKMNDKEIDEYMLKQRVEYQKVRPLLELVFNDLKIKTVLHLPGEPFIEYHLKAQELRKDRFVCVAGYGDGGPGYVPTDHAYPEGGYEPSVALAAPCEERLTRALAKLLRAGG